MLRDTSTETTDLDETALTAARFRDWHGRQQPVEWRTAGFGSRIRHLREAAGMSIVDVAVFAGMDTGRLQAIERGTAEVDLDDVFLLATALGVRVRTLFSGATEETRCGTDAQPARATGPCTPR